MTQIDCLFKDAIGANVDGYVLVGVDSWLMKDDEAASVTKLTAKVPLLAGACTLNLAPSDVEQVTYWFEVWHYKETTTSDPETGDPIITIVDEALLPRFYARVPNSNTPISFNQLAKQSGINRDNIDTAISAIVRRLYNSDDFWGTLQQTIFVPRGSYSATAWYSRGDIVTYEYGSYLYTFVDRTQGVLPSTATHWQQIGFRGETGAGTTGNDSPFGVGWAGQTDAPSRNAVYDALQQYALSSTVSGFASVDSPTFTGTPSRATAPISSDNSSQIPTTAWVQTLVATVSKAIVPVGSIIPYAGTSAPTGWVFCDGRSVSRTTFAELFAILGTTYNTGGEAGTDFRLPDLRGRFVAAADAMGINGAANRLTSASGLSSGALAVSGGSQTVTLDTTQIPSHNHPPASGYTAFYGAITGGGGTIPAGSGFAQATATGNTGGGLPHPNIPPVLILNYIIYTGI